MKQTLSIDVLDHFTLSSDLSFSENLIMNYARIHKTKLLTFAYSRNFMTYNTFITSYDRLTNIFHFIEEQQNENDENNPFLLAKDFERSILPAKVQFWKGRPRKYPPK